MYPSALSFRYDAFLTGRVMTSHFVWTSQLVLSIIGALVVSAIVTTWYLIRQRIQLRQKRTPRDKYEEEIRDAIDEAVSVVKKLRRAAGASRRINRILSLIEIVGGGYFAIASGIGAAIGAQTPTQTQLELNLIVGFAIVVASGVQNKFHPYTNGIELDNRAWALEVAHRHAETKLNRWVRESNPSGPFPRIEEELDLAMADAMRPIGSALRQEFPSQENTSVGSQFNGWAGTIASAPSTPAALNPADNLNKGAGQSG